MSGETKNTCASMTEWTKAYLEVTADVIKKGKGDSRWTYTNSIILACEKEKAATEGMLHMIENEMTSHDIARVKNEIEELLRTTPYEKLSYNIRGVINAFKIHDEKRETENRERCLKIAKKRAIAILNSGNAGCQLGAVNSFLSDARKWKLYNEGNVAYDILLCYAMNQPGKVDADFINGFN